MFIGSVASGLVYEQVKESRDGAQVDGDNTSRLRQLHAMFRRRQNGLNLM